MEIPLYGIYDLPPPLALAVVVAPDLAIRVAIREKAGTLESERERKRQKRKREDGKRAVRKANWI